MRSWLIDAIDQIALGEYLARSSISCGQRFGLIAVDNAIEFMLIAYVEVYTRLVGGHKSGGISKRDWQNIKRNFEDLLSHVCNLEPNLKKHEDHINRYHNLRNGLYHSGNPTTVSPSRVVKYAKLGREVLSILFSIGFAQNEWEEHVGIVGAALVSSDICPRIRRAVSFELENDLVRYSTEGQPSAKEAICLSLQGYGVLTGGSPDRDALLRSVTLSGYPITQPVLTSRLSDLRRERWIRKRNLQLTAKGLREIRKKYLV